MMLSRRLTSNLVKHNCLYHNQSKGYKGNYEKFPRNVTKVFTYGLATVSLLYGLKKLTEKDYIKFGNFKNALGLQAYAARIILDDMEDDDDAEAAKVIKLSARERRFVRFASMEYEGQIFMSPRDFIDSVTQESPRARVRRRPLTQEDVRKYLWTTPPFRKNSSSFLRDLDDHGLISYTEYLFLLSVLTKPQSGFEIAFNMFDMDGNQRVDKTEFLVIRALTLMLKSNGTFAKFDSYLDNSNNDLQSLTGSTKLQMKDIEQIWSDSQRKQVGEDGRDRYRSTILIKDAKAENQNEVKEIKFQDTSLLYHFFGPSGDRNMTFEDFRKFYSNFQTEILEIEFHEFSRGKPKISELDFAKILLRYTVLHQDDYENYLERVRTRIPEEKGITFDQFSRFCCFLNNLDDFTIAVKLYSFADHPVTQDEFARAVKVSTGFSLDDNVVNTVFQVFDINNDGSLSYSEFVAVMKDRIHRGFRSHLVRKEGWKAFKACVREEMKNY